MNLNIAAEVKFSDGWLQNFKIRHGIKVLDVSGEKNLADHDAAKRYSDIFSRHDLKPCQIYNADETSLYWRVSWREALNGLELLVKFTEKNHYYNVTEVVDTHIMLNNAYKKRHNAIKQADIRDMFAKTSKKVNPTQMDITEEITIEDDNTTPSIQRRPEP